MASNNKSTSAAAFKTKKRKHYLPHNKPVKKKGAYPLKPGVQGFFITCDGGRERQASQEAISVIEAFFEELLNGKDSGVKPSGLPKIPQNKKITFSYSDDEEEDEDKEENCHEEEGGGEEREKMTKPDSPEVNHYADEEEGRGEEREKMTKPDSPEVNHSCSGDSATNTLKPVNPDEERDTSELKDAKDGEENGETIDAPNDAEEPPVKKQCTENTLKSTTNGTEKSIDKLIDAELNELGDKSKRRFFHLDAGCNGLVFIQMRRRDGDPSPTEIVQHLMTSAAASRKHMSRFILRVLPIEASCYTSDEEISRAIKPLVEQYFPVETDKPQKFAVLYGARANTGIDRMKIINSVAKSVPAPHKVDLNNPDKTIVVEIVKTVCLIGVVEKYKELAKFNLRQLTSAKEETK